MATAATVVATMTRALLAHSDASDARNFKALHQRIRLPSSHRFTVRDPSGLEFPRTIAALGYRVARLDADLVLTRLGEAVDRVREEIAKAFGLAASLR